MAFTLSGSTITQTGTDTDLSGLSSIAGVNILSSMSGQAVYHISAASLVIEGSLSIDPNIEQLIVGESSSTINRDISINPDGILTIGEEINYPNGDKTYSNGLAIQLTDGQFYINPGAQMNWYGGMILVDISNQFSIQIRGGLRTFSKNCVWRNNNPIGAGSAMVFYDGSNTYVNGLTTEGIGALYVTAPVEMNQWAPSQCLSAILLSGGSPNGFLELRDFAPIGNFSGNNKYDLAFWSNKIFRLINCDVGSDVGGGSNTPNNATSRGLFEVRQEVFLNSVSFSGKSVEGIKYFIKDFNNGLRVSPVDTPQLIDNYTTDKIYEATTDNSGVASIVSDGGVLTAVIAKIDGTTGRFDDVIYDRRSEFNDTTDSFPICSIGYLYQPIRSSESLRGEGGSRITRTFVDDSLIKNLNRVAVDSYTTIDDSGMFYDSAKSFLVDNYAGETETIVSRSGNTIDAGTYNVVINNSGSAFAFDGTTITINAGSFVNAGITTTGTITIADGIDITGSTFSSLNLTTAINLTNVTVTGTLTHNDNITKEITYTNSNVGTLVNDGTGIVTVNLSSGSSVTDDSDAEIITQTAPTPSSINLNAPNANWAIYDNTNTRVANGSGNSTYSNAAGVDTGVWTVVKHRKGYNSEIYTWVSDDGSVNDFLYGEVPLLRPEGGNIYLGGSTTGINTFINADNYLEINAPNASVSAQSIIDAQQEFLSTLDGLDWIQSTGITGAPLFGILNGITYFLNIEGYQYDSIVGLTPESALAAVLVSSASHANIRTDNGGLSLVEANIPVTAQDIYDLFIDGTNADAFKSDLSILETQAQADARQALLIAEHTQTQLDISNISFSDTAILNAIEALNDISTADIRTELATELSRLDANVSNVAYDDTALTALVNALPTLAQMEASNALTAIADITGLSTHDALSVVNAMQAVANDFKATGFATPTNVSDSENNVIVEINQNETKLDTIIGSISSLPNTGDITTINNKIELLKKYHNNKTVFFAQDGSTPVIQSEAFSMVVYDNDGSTILKQVWFVKDPNGTPIASLLSEATGYINTAI